MGRRQAPGASVPGREQEVGFGVPAARLGMLKGKPQACVGLGISAVAHPCLQRVGAIILLGKKIVIYIPANLLLITQRKQTNTKEPEGDSAFAPVPALLIEMH